MKSVFLHPHFRSVAETSDWVFACVVSFFVYVRKIVSLGRCVVLTKGFDVKRSKKKQWGKGDTNGLCKVDLSVKAAPESGTSRSRLETTRAATQRATGTIRSRF